MPKSKLFSPSRIQAKQAIVLLHGGVFTDGDEKWNGPQAQSIAEHCQSDVYTLDFCKDSYQASLQDIKNFYKDLSKKYDGPVGLIGTSSGGFLALNVLKETGMPLPSFVVLICPVIHPEKREKLLSSSGAVHAPTICQKQLTFFKKHPYPLPDYQTRTPIHIIAADQDENVPLSLIRSEAPRFRNAQVHVLAGNHSLSHKASQEVNALILKLSTPHEAERSLQPS